MASRREFLSEVAAGSALLSPLGALAAAGEASATVTPHLIDVAGALHGFRLTEGEAAALAPQMSAQLKAITQVRALPRPLDLQPALHFDPRLPGVQYPAQSNRIRLSEGAGPRLPKDETAIAFASLLTQAQWIRSGQISSLKLTEMYLERIARIAPRLFCYITVTADLARAQARAMDAELKAGRYRGPLHGIPYSLKDTFDTQGIATTYGCILYRERVPNEDGAIVRKLREAGAVLLGKVAMGELANGWEWFGGSCRNPWNPDEPSGGSSAGSGSATAAGLCSFSIGTDSLGSILNPADRCGVVGLRPTFGRVPVQGSMPLTPSLERIGPLCRRVEDAAAILAVLNGFDPTSAASIDVGFDYDAALDLKGIRVGYSPAWFESLSFGDKNLKSEVSVEQRALRALEQLGVTLVPIELPALPYAALLENLYVEAAAVFEELTLSGRDAKLVNRAGWPLNWRKARLLSAVDYLQLERFRRQVMQHMHRLFGEVDMVFGPTYGSFELLMVMNYTGQPGLSLRAGFIESPTRSMVVERFMVSDDPSGPRHTITRNVAFHGRLFEEGKMLAVARRLEEKLAVADRHPTL